MSVRTDKALDSLGKNSSAFTWRGFRCCPYRRLWAWEGCQHMKLHPSVKVVGASLITENCLRQVGVTEELLEQIWIWQSPQCNQQRSEQLLRGVKVHVNSTWSDGGRHANLTLTFQSHFFPSLFLSIDVFCQRNQNVGLMSCFLFYGWPLFFFLVLDWTGEPVVKWSAALACYQFKSCYWSGV